MRLLSELCERFDRRQADFRAAKSVLRSEQLAMINAEDNLTNAEEAQDIIQHAAQAVQQEAHDKIAGVVCRCLAAIFDVPYTFKIEFERKRGKTEATLQFVRGDLILDDPINQAGGGVVDVASFALRLACLVLQRPPLRRLMVLDEPFKNIRGVQFRGRMRALLEKLANEMGVQFVTCIDASAYPEFVLGHVIEME